MGLGSCDSAEETASQALIRRGDAQTDSVGKLGLNGQSRCARIGSALEETYSHGEES
jgi:hypothetical protein